LDEKIFIQSQRLYVRTWKPSDLDAWYQVMSHPQTHLHTGEDPWSREETKSQLEWLLDHRIGWEPGTFNCPLILRATNLLIGRVGLNPFLEDEHIPEIEWTISHSTGEKDMPPKSVVRCLPMALRKRNFLPSWASHFRSTGYQRE